MPHIYADGLDVEEVSNLIKNQQLYGNFGNIKTYNKESLPGGEIILYSSSTGSKFNIPYKVRRIPKRTKFIVIRKGVSGGLITVGVECYAD